MKFRKKPVVIEAVQYIAEGEVPAIKFLGGYTQDDYKKEGDHIGSYETDTAIFTMCSDHTVSIQIKTLEGNMRVSDGDWIIKGVHGEYYPCKNDIFEKTYEPAE